MTHAELRTLLYQVLKSDEELRQSMILVWTNQKPPRAGVWWYKDEQYPAQPCYVYEAIGGAFVELWNGQILPIEKLLGQWAGPIAEPKEAGC